MKKKRISRLFSALMALAMVFTMLAPINASANGDAKPFKQNGTSEGTMQLKAAIAEQLNLLEGGSTLHKDLQGLSGNEEVSVIVHLSEKPVALEQGIQELAGKTFTRADAVKVEARVRDQHTFFKKEVNAKKITLKEGYSYNTVLNGFSATVKADDLKKLLDIKGVTLVEPDAEVHAFEDPLAKADGQVDAAMNTSISFLGIEKLWAEGIQGQGVKVAVLDTGIDKDHPDFAGIYKGGKNFIPNSATYTRARADNDASETSPVERPAGTPEFNATGSAFYTSHGTHVAGTIAAIGANPYGIKGIAPKVDLYAYRVLGAYGSGSTSGIIAAIEESVKQKMDVINLSLGGGANSETDGGSFAINNAMMAGTVSVIATGNSGPNRGTMGTPSTARLGIAVGNTTNPEANYDSNVHVVVGDYQLSKTIKLMGTTFGKDTATQLSGELEVVAVPGTGTKADYNGLDVDGKVVLVSRGDIAFVDKIEAARAAGAVATLIHNFAGGTNAPNASGTFLGDAFEFIPSYDLSQTDGDAIRAALKGGQGTVTFSNFNKTMTIGDEVNDSSSRGPSTPNFDIKPDVSAPGTNIMSTIPMYKADFPAASYEEAFTRKTGTSMATPHIAGIAALVKQANPDWNAFDVKVALSNSAKILNTAKYDVMAQGAGRVEAYAAARPNVLAYAMDEAVLDGSGEVVENIKGTVTFGPQSLKEDNISVTKEILVKDIKGNGGDYDVTVEVTKSFADAKVTVDKSSFTLDGEELLTVTLTASKKEDIKSGDEILGYIHIEGQDTKLVNSLSVDKSNLNLNTGDKAQLTVTETSTLEDGEFTGISLPFAADFGGKPASAIENFAITKTDLSFNNDGINDSAILSFKLIGDVKTNYIELWDIMDPDGGEYRDGYIGYLHAGTSLAADSYALNVTGNYKPWTSGAPQTKIPDGLYTIDFTAETVSGNPPIIGDYVGPIVVKTTKPKITGSIATERVTGQVTDKYIEYNEELADYGLDFDLNEKLHASYVIAQNGEVGQPVSFDLEQDGSFTFPLSTFNAETDTVTVKINDAAGNLGEAVIFEGVEAIVDPDPTEEVELEDPTDSGDSTEPTEPVDSTEPTDPVEEDNEIFVKVSSVEAGLLSKLTQIARIDVSESEGEKVTTIEEASDGPVSFSTFATDPGGDVTKVAKYAVEDEKVATVTEGLVTAKAAGTTTITITHGDNDPINVTVTVKDPAPVNPGPGNPGSGGSGGSGSGDSGTVSPVPTKPTPVIPVVPTPPTPITFTDTTGHWAELYIQKAATMGIFNGYMDGTFKPNNNLTRAQAASMMVRALGLHTDEAAPFGDIANYDDATKSEIAAAYKYGIIKGNNGNFNPADKVTRAQIALMIARAYEYKTGTKYTASVKESFSDYGNYNAETVNAISMLSDFGIVSGFEGKFMPNDPTTRAQAAKIFVNLMEKLQ